MAGQRQASAHTIASYRDTLRLLLGFVEAHTGIAPSRLDLADLDPGLIGAFLDHLERDRGSSIKTRNTQDRHPATADPLRLVDLEGNAGERLLAPRPPAAQLRLLAT